MVECLALGKEAQVQVLFARAKGFQKWLYALTVVRKRPLVRIALSR